MYLLFVRWRYQPIQFQFQFPQKKIFCEEEVYHCMKFPFFIFRNLLKATENTIKKILGDQQSNLFIVPYIDPGVVHLKLNLKIQISKSVNLPIFKKIQKRFKILLSLKMLLLNFSFNFTSHFLDNIKNRFFSFLSLFPFLFYRFYT